MAETGEAHDVGQAGGGGENPVTVPADEQRDGLLERDRETPMAIDPIVLPKRREFGACAEYRFDPNIDIRQLIPSRPGFLRGETGFSPISGYSPESASHERNDRRGAAQPDHEATATR